MDGSIRMSEVVETNTFSRLEWRVFEALVGEITRLAFAVTSEQITPLKFLLELENRVALLWSLRHNLRVKTALVKAETLMNADAVLACSQKMRELAELMAALHAGDADTMAPEYPPGGQERRERKEPKEREERTSVSDSASEEDRAHPKPETEIPEINPKPNPKPKQGAGTAQAQRGLGECDPSLSDSGSASDSVGARGVSVSDSPGPGPQVADRQRIAEDLIDRIDPIVNEVNKVNPVNEVPLRDAGIEEGC